MKCNAKVIYRKNGKIFITLPPGKPDEEYEYVISQFTQKELSKINLFAKNGLLYECQGKVKMEVSAEDEPYYGGTSAKLEVVYKCDTCGHSYYPNMPDSYNLNIWLNGILDKI